MDRALIIATQMPRRRRRRLLRVCLSMIDSLDSGEATPVSAEPESPQQNRRNDAHSRNRESARLVRRLRGVGRRCDGRFAKFLGLIRQRSSGARTIVLPGPRRLGGYYSGQRGSGRRTLTKRSASSRSWRTSSRNHHPPAYHTASAFRASISAKTLACASVRARGVMANPEPYPWFRDRFMNCLTQAEIENRGAGPCTPDPRAPLFPANVAAGT